MGSPPRTTTWREHYSRITSLREQARHPVAVGRHDHSFMFLTTGSKLMKNVGGSMQDYNRAIGTDGEQSPLITDISMGEDFNVAVSANGSVYTWGSSTNGYGQLGYATTEDTSSIAMKVNDLSGHKIISVSAGTDHCIAIDTNGLVYTWGNNSSGQCGFQSSDTAVQPRRLQLSADDYDVTALSVSAGSGHSLVVMEDGSLYGFGQLPGYENNTPHIITFPAHNVIVSAAAGAQHSLAITEAGKVFAWGSNQYGQLGNGHISQQHIQPTEVLFPDPQSVFFPHSPFIAVTTTANTSAAVTARGDLFVWGLTNENFIYTQPTDMTSIIPNEHLTAISINQHIITGITREGTLLVGHFLTHDIARIPRDYFDSATPNA